MRALLAMLVMVGCSTATLPPTDSGPECVLGTADHCGSCAKACPGADSAATRRTCSDATAAGACGITCLGDNYDLDGDLVNGCEALDGPRQDTPAAALLVTLPDASGGAGDCTNANNPCTVARQIFSDARDHDANPTTRLLGLEDWYKIVAVGTGTPEPMKTCLNIGNFPSDARYEVCISDAGSMTPTACATAAGGAASACVSPNGNPTAGTFFVRVRQLQSMSTRTLNRYALYFEH